MENSERPGISFLFLLFLFVGASLMSLKLHGIITFVNSIKLNLNLRDLGVLLSHDFIVRYNLISDLSSYA